MSSESSWREAIVDRFPARRTLPASEIFDQEWVHLAAPREEVMAVLELLELEYGLAPGFFRPNDLLDWLLETVVDNGFWSRTTNEVRAGDRALALGGYLEKRCKAHGTTVPRNLITLGQFVRACSGLAAT